MTLVATTFTNMESRQSCKITNMTRVKGLERRPIFLTFKMIIVLHDLYQADEIVMEIEGWK